MNLKLTSFIVFHLLMISKLALSQIQVTTPTEKSQSSEKTILETIESKYSELNLINKKIESDIFSSESEKEISFKMKYELELQIDIQLYSYLDSLNELKDFPEEELKALGTLVEKNDPYKYKKNIAPRLQKR